MVDIPKKIAFNLDSSSINEVVEEIEKYKKEIKRKIEVFVHRLADEGVYIAKVKITKHSAVYSRELRHSMQDEPGAEISNGAQWIVYTGCEWAPYVEFGTGVIGSRKPHPDKSIASWKYDINEHGESGWFYFKDGEWHWTKGMPSRPFMYETARDLRKRKTIAKIASEIFES